MNTEQIRKQAEEAYPMFSGEIGDNRNAFTYNDVRNFQQEAYIHSASTKQAEIDQLRTALEEIKEEAKDYAFSTERLKSLKDIHRIATHALITKSATND